MLFLLRRARQSLHHQSRCRTSSRRNACLLFATTFVGTRRTVVVVVVPETKASSFVNLLSGASSSSSSSRSCVGSDDGLCVVFSNALFAALGTGVVRRRRRVLLPRRALWQISVCRRARERESRVRTQVFVRLFSLLRDVFFEAFFLSFFPNKKKIFIQESMLVVCSWDANKKITRPHISATPHPKPISNTKP